MLFNSFSFVAFFVIVYSLYRALNHKNQNALLLISSYIFYAWWDWRFAFLLLLTTTVDFNVAKLIGASNHPKRRFRFLWISVLVDLGILAVFKYFNFFAESIYPFFGLLGFEPDPITLNIVLPVGISFYTFQSLGYVVDVYRSKLPPVRKFGEYALYVSFFPQLVAGPIERASHLIPQIQAKRNISNQFIQEGCWLLLLGYFKKVVIADNVAAIADAVFNQPGEYQGLAVLIGVYAFALQIFCDFSGYSDIARGLARLMGFDIMLNFRIPYLAETPRDFWRRWHISLSTWLRDYLYISLGGNRNGKWATYRNLFLTMLLGGLWHGAAWNFVFWGAYHGALLILHRLFSGKGILASRDIVSRCIRVAVMFHLVCFGWILFRINSINDLPVLLSALTTPVASNAHWLVAILLISWPLVIIQFLQTRGNDMLIFKQYKLVRQAAMFSLLFVYICLVGKVNGNEFIYFQF